MPLAYSAEFYVDTTSTPILQLLVSVHVVFSLFGNLGFPSHTRRWLLSARWCVFYLCTAQTARPATLSQEAQGHRVLWAVFFEPLYTFFKNAHFHLLVLLIA